MPPDGALMVSAVDIFKTSDGAGGCRRCSTGWRSRPAVSAVIGLDDDGVFLDLEGAVSDRGAGAPLGGRVADDPHASSRGNPCVMLGGFSPLVYARDADPRREHGPPARHRDATTKRCACWRWRSTCWAADQRRWRVAVTLRAGLVFNVWNTTQ